MKCVSDNTTWVNLKQKKLSACMRSKIYVCIKSTRSLERAILGFELNAIMQKMDWSAKDL